jgi:hypothetical protein
VLPAWCGAHRALGEDRFRITAPGFEQFVTGYEEAERTVDALAEHSSAEQLRLRAKGGGQGSPLSPLWGSPLNPTPAKHAWGGLFRPPLVRRPAFCLLKALDDPVDIYPHYDKALDGVHRERDTQHK